MNYNWSEIVVKTINKISASPSKFTKLNGENIQKMVEFINTPEIKRYANNAKRGSFAYRFRTLMHLFGVTFENGSVISIKPSASELILILKQLTPIAESGYVSSRFIERLAHSINNIKSFSADAWIVKMAKEGTLTDYLLKFVSDKQIEDSSNKPNIADEFMSKKSLKKTVSKTTEKKNNSSDEENVNVISALKVENQKLRKQIEKTRVSGGDDQLLLERIEESIKDVIPDLKFVNDKWNGDSTFKKNEHGTAVLHISDWHIGSKENVNGFNNFNYDIACERVKTLTNKYIGWTKMHRAMYTIDELVIIATGDMISGDIHDELIRTNEFSVPEQCVKSAALIAKLANSMSPFFKKVRVEYIVADNHSRTTKKIQFGDGKNSYNYLVGYMSKLMLSKTQNIEFNLYPEIQKVIKVEKLRYLITHGNCVRGGFAGIPFYSMQRKVGAEAAVRMNMGDTYHFDKIVMGHYHVPMRSTQYEMTGCLSSTTAFDQSAGRHCRACQTGWIVSKDNEIDYYELWLS